MTLSNSVRNGFAALAAFALLALLAVPSRAQDVTPEHLNAAHAAIAAIKATDSFDLILPQAAQALKQELIQKDPNLQEKIIAIVDEKTIALAGRRADLEKEAALAYAKVFSAKELNEMAAFYNSPTGKKLIAQGPIVTREVGKAAEIWQRGIARDLSQAVGKELGSEEAAPADAGSMVPPVPGQAAPGATANK